MQISESIRQALWPLWLLIGGLAIACAVTAFWKLKENKRKRWEAYSNKEANKAHRELLRGRRR